MKSFMIIFWSSLVTISCSHVSKKDSEIEARLKTETLHWTQGEVKNLTKAPKRITKVFRINVPIEKAFAVMAHEIPDWFTDIPSVDWFSPTGESIGVSQIQPGSSRVCKMGDDKLVERVPVYRNNKVIMYQVDTEKSTVGFPIENHLGIMAVIPDGDAKSIVIWHQYFDKKWHPLALVVTFGIDSLMDDGIENILSIYGGNKLY